VTIVFIKSRADKLFTIIISYKELRAGAPNVTPFVRLAAHYGGSLQFVGANSFRLRAQNWLRFVDLIAGPGSAEMSAVQFRRPIDIVRIYANSSECDVSHKFDAIGKGSIPCPSHQLRSLPRL
jgi:hypothetical protein